MPTRDVYLRIEQIAQYCPVDPDPTGQYRRDCMRSPGHEDGTIPPTEINARTLNALVYREYLDPNYLIPKPDKLVLADINEPPYHHRVPGTVIYSQPGERLRIHVLNTDTMPHSFHIHGVRYGIDSDGSWPLGTQSSDGRRSDEICPGSYWTYTLEVTGEMLGAWPFHEHYQHVAQSVDRGLFGGLIVQPPGDEELPPRAKLPDKLAKLVEELRHQPFGSGALGMGGHHGGPPHGHGGAEHGEAHGRGRRGRGRAGLGPPGLERLLESLEEWAHLPHAHPVPGPSSVLHVPLFFHVMRGAGTPAFESPDLRSGDSFERVFGVEGEFHYHCSHHADMQGTVRVSAGGSALETVRIVDPPLSPVMRFNPASVTVRPGGMVRWEHGGSLVHTVTEDGAGMPTYCFNGRSFVGNTPTILADASQRIRWYVFNLDLGMLWHNFHPHAQRWRFANEPLDIRSLGPAESFTLETRAPPVLLDLPGRGHESEEHEGKGKKEKDKENEKEKEKGKPKGAQRYRLRGDFPFHCHVEMHMMQGMVGLVRSRQEVWLTPAEVAAIAPTTGLPLDPGNNDCQPADLDRCHTQECGRWEIALDVPKVTMMHVALLPKTSKVLFWGYTLDDQSRVWDSAPGGVLAEPDNQPAEEAPGAPPPNASFSDLWSAEHAFLNTSEGTLLVHGGLSSGDKQAFLFHPGTASGLGRWELIAPTADERFYSTTLTLEDGRALTLFGSPRAGPASNSMEVYDPTAGPSGAWDPPITPVFTEYLFYPWTYLLPGGELFIAGPQEVTRRFDWTTTPIGVSLAVNTIAGSRGSNQNGTSVLLPLRPPNYEPRVLIAGGTGAAGLTAEMIDLSLPSPAWQSLPDMNRSRNQLPNAILLPDGRVFVAGGITSEGGPGEIFDPDDPDAGWLLCGELTHHRNYHSAAILLPDGSVLVGGGEWSSETPRALERFFPGYCFKPRPAIAAGGVPASATYGATFAVQTPDASAIAEVVLLRPGAATHGFDMSQRFVECTIANRAASSLQVQAPPDGTVAPPGYYLLFIVNAGRVPSKGEWIRLGP